MNGGQGVVVKSCQPDIDGNFALKDPGTNWFPFMVDYNGTPGDPEDDVESPGSFQVIKPSTGNSDFSERDFCEDLRTFATP